ncbi:MAG: chorismate synthase [Lachnospiraceae bacterium]|nr:chorismate synthase [Lachnospiraceae bacterium]
MAGSSFGTIFKITTWGESHGKALGVVIDGCPAGLELSEADIQKYLDRRKPGTSALTTQRKENDEVEILSGVFEGKTTGTPISLMVRNTSQISADYGDIATYYRPGHADYTFDQKYGFRDYRGGGRSSGRETIGRVAAGAIACKILEQLGVTVKAYTKSIGPIEINPSSYDEALRLTTPTAMPDAKANEETIAYLAKAREAMDSVGGCMECVVDGLPAGIGDPVFEKLDANLAKAIMSIGAVKAVEIGDGVAVSKRSGSENNDAFISCKAQTCMNTEASYQESSKSVLDSKITKMHPSNNISKLTNHAGGILGGISDGSQIVIRAHVKPTPSIYQTQHTVNQQGEEIEIQIKGRHDPIIVPRAVVVMECMTALTILDAMMLNATAKLETLKLVYKAKK